MRFPVKVVPTCIMQQYQLDPLFQNGHVLVEIRKSMFGLSQDDKLANDRLVKLTSSQTADMLANVRDTSIISSKTATDRQKNTPGLFTHTTRPTAQHFADALESLYTITTEWPGTCYFGLTLDWEYEARTVDISMPGNITQAIAKFQHEPPIVPNTHHRPMRHRPTVPRFN
jgi:hypothetical protein